MFRRFIIIFTLAAALAGTAGVAQGLRNRPGQRGAFAGPFTGDRLERLQQRLNLSEVQMNGIRALQETRRTEMESLRQELQQKRQTLRQHMQEPNPNPSDVGQATLSLKETRERMREINERFISGVKGLLTPEQLQQLPKRPR